MLIEFLELFLDVTILTFKMVVGFGLMVGAYILTGLFIDEVSKRFGWMRIPLCFFFGGLSVTFLLTLILFVVKKATLS